MSANRIQLNIDKTQLLLIGKSSTLKMTNNFQLNVNGTVIKRVKSLKILGVHIDEGLNFDEHCKNVIQKCNKNFATIYKLKRILPTDKKVILIHALIFSILNYACTVWGSNLNKTQTADLNQIIRRCARFALGKLKFDSISSDICNELKWLTTDYRIIYEITLLAYKMTFSPPNSISHDYLDFSTKIVRETRNKLHREPAITTNSNWGMKSFRYKAVLYWLQLPSEVFTSSTGEASFLIFKKNLMKHILKLQQENHQRVVDNDEQIYIEETIKYISQLYKRTH